MNSPQYMLEARVFVAAEGELAEEYQIALLLVHEEEVPQEGLGVETVLLKTPNLKAHGCIHQVAFC